MTLSQRVLALKPIKKASSICCYVALPDEVETRPLIEALWLAEKQVSAPKIVGPGDMVTVSIKQWNDLAEGRFGILEPRAQEPIITRLEVVIVPGQRFTAQGDRQGRGYGYYDRFLARYADAVRIGLCKDAQLSLQLTVQPHDQPMDWIITPTQVFETNRRTTNPA